MSRKIKLSKKHWNKIEKEIIYLISSNNFGEFLRDEVAFDLSESDEEFGDVLDSVSLEVYKRIKKAFLRKS